MTITPLPAGPPRSRPSHLRYGKVLRRPTAALPAEEESLTVTFEVTLTGDDRYLDAVDVLDTLRRVTQRLTTASIGVRPPLAPIERPSTVDQEPSRPDRIEILAASREVRQDGRPIPFTRGHRTVDVHIRRLRAKLTDRSVVTTVRGVGYRLADDAGIDVLAEG